MELDPLVLSRLQFAANISFHILFPTITIGMCWVLLFFRIMYTRTGNKDWEYAYFYWVKVFALSFAMGVVSGVTMSFQFGTNWPGFMQKAGNIAGPLLGYEVLTAFFLEASFLGIMLFGKDRVSNKLHLISTSLVAFGTSFSAFWILSLNSWMQTPAGYVMENGQFVADDWWAIVFNPSFPYRMAHMFVASLLTCSFLLMGISSWRVLKGIDGPGTWKVMKTGVAIAAVFAPLQIFIGDLHGLNTLEHQPAKVAAIEAIWETEKGADFTIIGFPDEKAGETHFALKIPKAASLILTHEWEGELKGLNEFSGKTPPVAPVFWSFRIMLAIGGLMLLVSWWAVWELWRKRKGSGRIENPLLIRAISLMTFSGWIAVLCGWYVTEVGRQPWIVQNVLTVNDVVADHGGGVMLSTLVAYLTLYVFLLGFYIYTLKYMASKPSQSLQKMHEYYPNQAHIEEAK